jgi:hypothetical protein
MSDNRHAPSERISWLPPAGPLTGAELFPIVQGGRTVVVTLAQIAVGDLGHQLVLTKVMPLLRRVLKLPGGQT